MSSIIDPKWMARLSEKQVAASVERVAQKQKDQPLSRGQIISEHPFLRISDFKNIPHDDIIRRRGFYPFRVYKRDNPALLACIEGVKDRPITPTAYEIRKERQQEKFSKFLAEQREREARQPKILVQQVKGGLWGSYVTPVGQERRLMG